MKRLLLVAAFACSGANAADWELVAGNDTQSIYIDKTSLVRAGPNRKAWFLWDFVSAQETKTYPKAKYFSAKELTMFDCAERTSGSYQGTMYAEQLGQGAAVDSWRVKFTPSMFSDVTPESVGEAMLNYVCRQRMK